MVPTYVGREDGDVPCLVSLLCEVQCKTGCHARLSAVLLGCIFVFASLRVTVVPEVDIMPHTLDLRVGSHTRMVL